MTSHSSKDKVQKKRIACSYELIIIGIEIPISN